MNEIGLFIRHQAKPGMRDELQRVWEKYVKPRAAANSDHLAYYFCRDVADPDMVCVFQLYSNETAMKEFLAGPWYSDYLAEIAPYIAAGPQITPATLVWSKETEPSSDAESELSR